MIVIPTVCRCKLYFLDFNINKWFISIYPLHLHVSHESLSLFVMFFEQDKFNRMDWIPVNQKSRNSKTTSSSWNTTWIQDLWWANAARPFPIYTKMWFDIILSSLYHCANSSSSFRSYRSWQIWGIVFVYSWTPSITSKYISKIFWCRLLQKRLQLLQECVDCLDQCQVRLINRLKAWQWEQHKATIGHPFDENLHPLQTW